MSLRQGEHDSLLTYLEKFKSEKNVVMSLFGEGILNGHVERTQEYKDISDADTVQQAREQKEMKDKAHEQFWGLLFLKQSDQGKYGRLLREFRQAYANKQRDLYPEDLTNTFEVMKTVNVKKKPRNRNGNDKDKNSNDPQGHNLQPGAESFAQSGKEIRCFCCGKEGELSTDCPLKDKIPSKDWFN